MEPKILAHQAKLRTFRKPARMLKFLASFCATPRGFMAHVIDKGETTTTKGLMVLNYIYIYIHTFFFGLLGLTCRGYRGDAMDSQGNSLVQGSGLDPKSLVMGHQYPHGHYTGFASCCSCEPW